MLTSLATNSNNFTMTNQTSESIMSTGGWLGQLSLALEQLDMNDKELEVVIGGTQVYEIEGAGTKWAPIKGTRKYDKDAFIIIRKPREVVSSEPMEDFNPEHGVYEWDHADAPSE